MIRVKICILALMLLFVGCGGVFADVPEQLDKKELLTAVRKAKGRVVVLNFFATWCKPCIKEMPGLIEIRKNFSEEDLYLLGLSVDANPKQLEAYLNKTPINFPVYRASQDASAFFRIRSIPRIMIYNKEGKLVVNHEGAVTAGQIRAAVEPLLRQ